MAKKIKAVENLVCERNKAKRGKKPYEMREIFHYGNGQDKINTEKDFKRFSWISEKALVCCIQFFYLV